MLEASVLDDGTMDTVIAVYCSECKETWEERFDGETAADYRDDDGYLSDDKAKELLDNFNVECPYCES